MNMDINILRGQSVNSSANNSREFLVHLSISSIVYADRVQALNNSLSWADQVKNSESQEIILSYANPEVKENNQANEAIATTIMLEHHIMRMQIYINSKRLNHYQSLTRLISC